MNRRDLPAHFRVLRASALVARFYATSEFSIVLDMKQMPAARLGAMKLAFFLAALVHASAFAQTLQTDNPKPLVIEPGPTLRILPTSHPVVLPSPSESPESRLAKSLAAAGTQSFVQSGIESSKEALRECRRGDYPGGGSGLLSMPFGRPQSRTDHCFR
jgi:hypothetical protein